MEDRIDNEEQLLAWIEGELTAEEAAQISAMLARDPKLSNLLHELRADRALLRQLGEVEAPEDLLADAQQQLERTLLLEGAQADNADLAAVGRAGRRGSGLRFGAIGSLAAVLLLAVTVGIAWQLGVLPGARPSPTPAPQPSDFALTDRDDPLAPETSPPSHALREDAADHPAELPDEPTLALADAVPPDLDLPADAVEPLPAIAAREPAPLAELAPQREAPPQQRLERLGVQAQVAGLVPSTRESVRHDAPVEVLVWAGDTALNVDLALLQEPQLQERIVLRTSRNSAEYVQRNFSQLAQVDRAPAKERDETDMAEKAARHSLRPTAPAPEPRDERQRGVPGDDVHQPRAEARFTAYAHPAPERDIPGETAIPLADPRDYSRIWLEAPDGELYELWVRLAELPTFVASLNTPSQVAWLEFGSEGRLPHEQLTPRQSLIADRLLLWGREVWDAARRQIPAAPTPAPDPPGEDARDETLPADSSAVR